MNRRSFLTQTSALVAAAALPKLSHASATQPLDKALEQNSTPQMAFPKGFLCGSATASYQVEGGWNLDGRGESIWDRFSHTPGNVKGGWTGDIACDTYHRFSEDIAIMKQLNLRSYRYSIAWPRIQPSGQGPLNQKGIDYYKRLTDTVLAAGMRPLVTLFHWDLPQTLEDHGGWPNRDTAARFADYVEIAVKALGDRISTWAIFNEPWVFTYVGYAEGRHAPGKTDFDLFLKSAHTVNLAQGDAFRAIKAIAPKSKVGTAFSMFEAHRVVGRLGRHYCRESGDEPAEVIVDSDEIERSGHSFLVATLESPLPRVECRERRHRDSGREGLSPETTRC